MIKIVKDKDPIWDTDNFDVILIGTSTLNRLTNGFQSKIRYKYPFVEEANQKTKYGDAAKLGTRLTVGEKPIISLMYICNYASSALNNVDYDALTKCLKTANAEFKGKSVLMTIVGASEFDGNGDKDKCLEIIKENTEDLNVTIYDYVQRNKREEIREQDRYLYSLRLTDKEKYNALKPIFNEYLKKLYLHD